MAGLDGCRARQSGVSTPISLLWLRRRRDKTTRRAPNFPRRNSINSGATQRHPTQVSTIGARVSVWSRSSSVKHQRLWQIQYYSDAAIESSPSADGTPLCPPLFQSGSYRLEEQAGGESNPFPSSPASCASHRNAGQLYGVQRLAALLLTVHEESSGPKRWIPTVEIGNPSNSTGPYLRLLSDSLQLVQLPVTVVSAMTLETLTVGQVPVNGWTSIDGHGGRAAEHGPLWRRCCLDEKCRSTMVANGAVRSMQICASEAVCFPTVPLVTTLYRQRLLYSRVDCLGQTDRPTVMTWNIDLEAYIC